MFQSFNDIYNWLPLFMLAYFRVSSFFMTATIFGSENVPVRIRFILSLTVTIIIFPLIPKTNIEVVSLVTMLLVIKQIIIGFAAGFVFKLVFEMIIITGQLVAYQTGLGFATLVNPISGITVPMVSQVYLLAALLIFLALNGHLMLIQFLVASFHSLPLDTLTFGSFKLGVLLDFSKIIFNGAISIALPAIIAILIVNIIFALMTSSAPQLNIFNIGFPITLIFGLIIIYISFGNTLSNVKEYFQQGFSTLATLLNERM